MASSDKDTSQSISFGEAMSAPEAERATKLAVVSEDLRKELEAMASAARDLILSQPPISLLGYLWGQLFIAATTHHRKRGEAHPDKEAIRSFQFVLEYLHAVWSSHVGEFAKGEN